MSSTSSPLISIGLPTYNRSELLKSAVRSLERQTYKHIEIIISDNASTDATHDLCMQLARKDKRIRYFRQDKNTGAMNNFLFVFQKAKGPYFMWASDDDLWDATYCRILLDVHRHNPRCPLVFSRAIAFDNVHKKPFNLRIDKSFPYSYGSCLKYMMEGITFPSRTMFYGMYKTSCLKKIRRDRFYSGGHEFTDEHLLLFSLIMKYGEFRYTPDTYLLKRNSGYFLNKYYSYKTVPLNLIFFKKSLQYLKGYFYGMRYYLIIVRWIIHLKLPMQQKLYFTYYYTRMTFIFYIQMTHEMVKAFCDILIK